MGCDYSTQGVKLFTGLITNTTTVVGIDRQADGGLHLTVAAFGEQLRRGDSIALDGCCLTVVAGTAEKISFDLSQATQQRTTLATLKQGQRLNVELPLRWGDRLHGHLVSGHVDAVAEVKAITSTPAHGFDLTVTVPHGHAAQILPQAAVALNGVSLTIATVHNDAQGQPQTLAVCLIPETCRRTNLAALTPGQQVNFESDMLGKYATNHAAARCATHGFL